MYHKIILADNKFWDWLFPKNGTEYSGINSYLQFIHEYQIDKGYIIDMSCEHEPLRHSQIMDNLRSCMPREYFLEIQFCAKVYSTFFGKVFPPLAAQIDQLAYIEWLLYTEPSNLRYRDHLIHMFKVAYVIDRFFNFKPLLKKIVSWQFRSRHFKV